ncbi:hypothetical protein EV194_101227 [Natronoflexus pectinivorans]|uniref:Uncharacterized protein n=1 Tax=Natronoflexus pectinivorans TaxID=682526 RepID=A0A4R2GNI7_9BACT|nr:hypothetical protein EV194_101227 [Natronoflexus pectinivorans]
MFINPTSTRNILANYLSQMNLTLQNLSLFRIIKTFLRKRTIWISEEFIILILYCKVFIGALLLSNSNPTRNADQNSS